METENTELPHEQLLLDPNNYRFLDITGYKKVALKERYAEAGVQNRALGLLKDSPSFDLDALMESIRNNGFVKLDQIVVEEFDEVEGVKRYLVIEGNRRVAAVKTLLSDHEGGAVDLSDSVRSSMEVLPVIIVRGNDEERGAFQKTLMAIRHVSGIREWGPYQQARLVVEMYEQGDQQFGQVAKKIGISAQEVGRRFRASKALEQMENDDEFRLHANPKLYSFFHEAVSQPKVRDWLDFSDETYQAENEESKRLFYELLSPREIDGEKRPPKLQNANQQVRQLKFIVDKIIPLEILSDPERLFEDAVREAQSEVTEDDPGLLESSLSQALNALRKPGVDAWSEPSDKARQLWTDLNKVFGSIKKVIEDDM